MKGDVSLDAKFPLIAGCLSTLTIIALIAVAIIGKAVLAPITLALVLGIVVSPAIEYGTRKGLPRLALSLFMVVIILCMIAGLLMLVQPAFTILTQLLPDIMTKVRTFFASLSTAFAGLETLGEELGQSGRLTEGDIAEQVPTLIDAIWLAPNFGAQFLIFVGTLFFFVLTRNELYESMPQRTDIVRQADRAVSRYFAAVTIVNLALGAATALAMTLIGVEYPLVWGLAAGLLNFILYLGPICIMTALLVAGLVQFGGAYAFLPPVAFFLLNAVEAQFVTPMIVGQQVRVNPLFVFLAIITGLWMWGPVGAIVALPLVIWIGRLLKPV